MVIFQVAGPEGKVIEGHLMPDHVHMLVSIPPKIGASGFMGCLKGRSSPFMFDRPATSQGPSGLNGGSGQGLEPLAWDHRVMP